MLGYSVLKGASPPENVCVCNTQVKLVSLRRSNVGEIDEEERIRDVYFWSKIPGGQK